MKAATGELQLTVITLIAIAAVIGFFWIMWPTIKDSIGGSWKQVSCIKRDAQGNCTEYAKEQVNTEEDYKTGNGG